jgi:hypothetical protein
MMMIDVRFPMGLLFLALGVILTAAGIIDPDPLTSLQRKVGINVNLYWGITMVLFGLVSLLLASRKPDVAGSQHDGTAVPPIKP